MNARAPTAILVGNPNSGKTTLFNALTGLSARVGNYPGITVEHREGKVELGAGPQGPQQLTLIDLPGTYSLVPRSDDEVVAVRGVLGLLPESHAPDVIIVVVDATSLERNLYLVGQLVELPLPLIVALTMTDTLHHDGFRTNTALLAKRLGVPVVEAPATRGGSDALRAVLRTFAQQPRRVVPVAPPTLDGVTADAMETVRAAGHGIAVGCARSGLPLDGCEDALGLFAAGAAIMGTLHKLGLPPGAVVDDERLRNLQHAVSQAVDHRYGRARAWAADVIVSRGDETTADSAISPSVFEPRSAATTRRIDAVALHPVLGPALLTTIFLVLFQALFSWSAPLMDGIAWVMGAAGDWVGSLVPTSVPLVRSLLVNGVVAGVGNVVVFVPQIAVLFFFLSLLEDSGYLARAAFLLDKLMARVGLHGRAFVPLLSGFACAVPAILATRTIESTKDRLVTILVTPLISCSARLPVYALMIATVFSTQPPVFGVLAPGVIVMVSMYALSIVAAVGMAAVFKRTLLRSPTPPLVLELPPYRLPKVGAVARAVLSRVRIFLTEAGTVILAITVVLWALFTFPRDDAAEHARAQAVAAAQQTMPPGPELEAELERIQGRAAQEGVEKSIAGRLGHALEPVIAPLGFDWKLGVGLIASFAAREVLVSTLGLVYGLGDGSDEESPSLREAMRSDRRADGTPVYTPLVGLSLLVFFVLAMQCMSTLAVVKRETGGWRWPMFQFGYMTSLAYGAAWVVTQGGRLLGFD